MLTLHVSGIWQMDIDLVEILKVCIIIMNNELLKLSNILEIIIKFG